MRRIGCENRSLPVPFSIPSLSIFMAGEPTGATL
jgi:hypothetical protein